MLKPLVKDCGEMGYSHCAKISPTDYLITKGKNCTFAMVKFGPAPLLHLKQGDKLASLRRYKQFCQKGLT